MAEVANGWTEILCWFLKPSSELTHGHSRLQYTAQSNSQLQWDGKYTLRLLGETSKSKGKGWDYRKRWRVWNKYDICHSLQSKKLDTNYFRYETLGPYLNIYQKGIYRYFWVSLMAQTIKNLPAMQETRVRSLCQVDPQEYLLQYSCLENFKDRGAWQGYSLCGCKESDMTEQLTLFYFEKTLRKIYVCLFCFVFVFRRNTMFSKKCQLI